MDPHCFWKLDPDPSKNSGTFEAQNGGVEAQYGGCIGQWWQIRITLTRSRILIRIEVKSWIRIRIKVMRIRNPVTPRLLLNFCTDKGFDLVL
jgi:hypothetical protein